MMMQLMMILLIFKQHKHHHLVHPVYYLLLLVQAMSHILLVAVVHNSNHNLQLYGTGVLCLILQVVVVMLTVQVSAVAMQQRVISVTLAYVLHSQVRLPNCCMRQMSIVCII
jgi:cobalamin biosynthesis protein CobD/CbiB